MAGSAIAIPMMPMPALTLPIHGIQPPERREALFVEERSAVLVLPLRCQLTDSSRTRGKANIMQRLSKQNKSLLHYSRLIAALITALLKTGFPGGKIKRSKPLGRTMRTHYVLSE